MTQQEKFKILTGTVTRYFEAGTSERTGGPTPHKFILDVAGEEAQLAVFNKDDGTLPPVLIGLDLKTIEGKEVQAIAQWKSEWENKDGVKIQQYRPQQIQIMGSNSPAPEEFDEEFEEEVQQASLGVIQLDDTPFELEEEEAEQPAPKPKKKPIAKAQPAEPPPVVQTDKDTLIVDQVIFKGAIELRAAGVDVVEASAIAITLWNHIRARHIRGVEGEDEA